MALRKTTGRPGRNWFSVAAEVWQMADEMLVSQARWLPQYQAEIPAISQRLKELEQKGKRVQLQDTPGAARLHVKTVAEMSQDKIEARANVSAADKGKMTKVS